MGTFTAGTGKINQSTNKEEQINQRHAILRDQFDVSNTVKRLADRLFEVEKSS